MLIFIRFNIFRNDKAKFLRQGTLIHSGKVYSFDIINI